MARQKPPKLYPNHRLPLLLFVVFAAGCDMLDMYDEQRFEPLEASGFFDDGASARPLVAGTVARGDLRADEAFYTGRADGKYVTTLPLDLDRDELRGFLARGQERFNIYCSPCHGRDGDGRGMIVQRGFTRPPSFVRTRRLLEDAPLGHFYDVISNGFGAMPSYASRIEPRDRWAVAAYIRALQRSQNAQLDDVPEDQRDNIVDSMAVEAGERQKRGAAERRDLEEKELERDIKKHRRSPEEGERRHRELEEKRGDSTRSSTDARDQHQPRRSTRHSRWLGQSLVRTGAATQERAAAKRCPGGEATGASLRLCPSHHLDVHRTMMVMSRRGGQA